MESKNPRKILIKRPTAATQVVKSEPVPKPKAPKAPKAVKPVADKKPTINTEKVVKPAKAPSPIKSPIKTPSKKVSILKPENPIKIPTPRVISVEIIEETIYIDTEYIKLDSFLKFAGVAGTGGHGKEIVAEGVCYVNDVICTERGKKIRPGDIVKVDNYVLGVKNSADR